MEVSSKDKINGELALLKLEITVDVLVSVLKYEIVFSFSYPNKYWVSLIISIHGIWLYL